jgi:hypothetical protein
MNGKLEIGQVGMKFRGGVWPGRRAERIAQLTFQRVQELVAQNGFGAGESRSIERLAPRPVRVSPGTSDEAIAGAAALEVYRSLTKG